MAGYIIGGAVLLLLAVLVIRALCFRPKSQPLCAPEAVTFDQDAAITALQKLVQRLSPTKIIYYLLVEKKNLVFDQTKHLT